MVYSLVAHLLTLAIPVLILRLLQLFPRPPPRRKTPGKRDTRLLVVLGSGVHTAEILATLRNLDTIKYTHRSYVVSSGDAFSALKAKEFEAGLKDQARAKGGSYGGYDIAVVPRARKIYQSLLSTPISSLQCLAACFGVLRAPDARTASETGQPSKGPFYPDLIISNGPGTAVIVILASIILRTLGLPGTSRSMRTIYVESWARVRRLSLSGKILVRVVDRFIVQWETLLPATGGNGEFLGVLV